MPRSPSAVRSALQSAALELYAERGYSATTAAAIAERVGVTARTFFRYFPDKREVVFGDAAEIDRAVAGALPPGKDGTVDAWQVVRDALSAVGAVLQDRRAELRTRADVIRAESDLRERELGKQHQLTTALEDGLVARAVDPPTAALVAAVAMAVFRVTYAAWLEDDAIEALAERLVQALDIVHPG